MTSTVSEVFNKNAKAYQDKFMDFALYNDTFDQFCERVATSDAQILDVGCGPGNISRYLLSRRPDLKLLGIDLAPNMIQLAKANNPTATFAIMDGRDIESLQQKFDGIVCGFLFPYLSLTEIDHFIAIAIHKLNTGGIFYLSTMEADATHQSGWKRSSTGDELYMYYHREEDLSSTLIKHGFTDIAIQRKEFAEPDGSKTTDLVIVANLSTSTA